MAGGIGADAKKYTIVSTRDRLLPDQTLGLIRMQAKDLSDNLSANWGRNQPKRSKSPARIQEVQQPTAKAKRGIKLENERRL